MNGVYRGGQQNSSSADKQRIGRRGNPNRNNTQEYAGFRL